MSQNYTQPLSESVSGRPILITPSAEPGTLIHTATGSDRHFLTVFIASRTPIDYVESVYVRLIKGTTGEYVSDGLIRVEADKKTIIEPGILIQDSEVRIVIDTEATTVDLSQLQLLVTGQVFVRAD